MSDTNKHYLPSRLDDSGKFLWWDTDVLMVGVLFILLGITLDHGFSGLVVGIVLATGYSKLKTGKHPGMANHIIHWFTGVIRFKGLPRSSDRELIG